VDNEEGKMPIEIKWKIGPKKRGNWRTELVLTRRYFGEELALRPFLGFRKRYDLPDKIYFGRTESAAKAGHDYCRTIMTMDVKINKWIDEPGVDDNNIKNFDCNSLCGGGCEGCRAFLPWRPGVPDYSDYEVVFRQIARDLCETWNKAVAEAMESAEYEAEPVIITSDNCLSTTMKGVRQNLAEKPSRKLKIA